MNRAPNHALQRTRPSHSGCNPRVLWAGSLYRVVRQHRALMQFLRVILVVALAAASMSCRSPDSNHQTMKVREALPTLKRMMADTGADSRHPRPQVAWQVFRRFAQIPVDCASDG